MEYIIIILILVIVVLMFSNDKVEKFEIPIINPYSLDLHADASLREDLWNFAHTRKLYYYDNVVPFHFKE